MFHKTRFHRITFITALCFFGAFDPFVFARTINLPEEYPSIQEAVEAASSGDVISVNQHDVFLLKENPEVIIYAGRSGVLVKDMNLTIVGNIANTRVRIAHSKYYIPTSGSDFYETVSDNMLVIDNSDVTLMNVQLTSPHFSIFNNYPPPVHVLSGKLALIDVDFTGNIISRGDLEIDRSIIFGYSCAGPTDPHDVFKRRYLAIPSIYCYNQVSPSIRIDNTVIECNTKQGARAIVCDGISNAKIQIANSIVRSGSITRIYKESDDYQSLDSLWEAPGRNMALSGLMVANCANVIFDLEGSVFYGGSSFGFVRIDDGRRFVPGGPGLEIIRSNAIRINGGEAFGGNGAQGGNYGFFDRTKYHSGDGGNGLYITDSSVFLNNVKTITGQGGKSVPADCIEPGVDGQPIYYDENSTVVFGSAVEDWAIYQ